MLERAKDLRQGMTEAERKLWYHLRAGRFSGAKFKRQKPLGPYIVDFVCLRRKLVIEVDGGQHAERAKRDRARDRWLEQEGFKVMRFWNDDVLQDTEMVLTVILDALSPSPSPASGRGE